MFTIIIVLNYYLKHVIDCYSALFTLNLLRLDIKDSKLYICFSIGLLSLALLRHYMLLLRRRVSSIR
jgi:hypothetical protein